MLWIFIALLAGWLLPALVRLNYIQEEIAAALSANIGRAVHIGDVHPHILNGWDSGVGVGLGVQVDNVEIMEDPAFGVEPLARIEKLEATLALRSIWHRRLEFSSVVLRNPSVNLVRGKTGQWNLLVLPMAGLQSSRADGGAPARPERYPDVRVVDGRLNFKQDNRKKSFYLSGLNVELQAPGQADQPWGIKFSGTPTRASFEQIPALIVRGEGQIGPFSAGAIPEAGVPLKLSWQARDALLGEVAAVMAGSSQGMHGVVSVVGEASGTSTLLRISGKAAIRDLHRWDVIPQQTSMELPAEFSGILDTQQDVFRLSRLTIPLRVNEAEAGVIEVSGRVEGISKDPQLRLEAQANNLSLSALRDLSEPLALPLDPSISVSGVVNGELQLWGLPSQWHGELNVERLEIAKSWKAGSTDAVQVSKVQFDPVPIRMAEGKYSAGPVNARFASGSPIRISVQENFLEQTRRVSLRGDAVPLADLLAWFPEQGISRVIVGNGSAALNMNVSQSKDDLPAYAGRATVTNAEWPLPGPLGSVGVDSARMQWKNRTVEIRSIEGRLQEAGMRGGAVITFPARQAAAAERATKLALDLRVERVNLDAPQAEASRKQNENWFAAWLHNQPVEAQDGAAPLVISGKVVIDRLTYGGVEFSKFNATGNWDGSRLEVDPFVAELAGGRASGTVLVQFPAAAKSPQDSQQAALSISADLTRIEVDKLLANFPDTADQYAGQLSGKVRMGGRGTDWPQLLTNLTGDAELTGKNVVLARWPMPATWPVRDEAGSDDKGTRLAELSTRIAIKADGITILRFDAAKVDDDPIESHEGHLQASGTIGFDQAVQIKALERSPGHPSPLEYQWTGSLTAPQLQVPAALARNGTTTPR